VWRAWLKEVQKVIGEKLDIVSGPIGDLTQIGANGSVVDSGKKLEDMWPIGSIYLSVSSTNPYVIFGFGVWQQSAEGQFIVGYSDGDDLFGSAGGTGGARTHLHVIDPPSTNATTSIGNETIDMQYVANAANVVPIPTANHTHDVTVDIAAFNSANANNIPPYVVVYVWKRTA
jgi:hypothetical protein